MKNPTLFTALLLVFVLPSIAGLEWFEASPTGVPGAPLSEEGPSAEGWSLSIDRKQDGEYRSLYVDGESRGTTVFRRSAGRLVAREELDSQGSLVSRVEYAYDAQGNPRAVFIDLDAADSGSSRVTTDQWISADGRGRRIASGSGKDWQLTDMDDTGNPTRQLTLDGQEITDEISWSRDDDGTLKEEIRRTGDVEIRSLYDSEGRLLSESISRGPVTILTRNYSWFDGNLIRVEEKGEGRLVVREMEWSGDRMSRETRSIDGVLASDTHWPIPEEKVETLYRDGEPVIRIYWSDGVKLKEEFLKAGEVIRVREGRG